MKSELSVLHLGNPQALRECAELWDDLWLRSNVTHPTAQAALIANWLDHYQSGDRFRAVVVSDGSKLIAALPLLTRAKGHVVPCMDVPGNEWSSAGQLLLDPACDMDRACDVLVAALRELDCSAFWFASVPISGYWWKSLMEAARRAGWSVDARRRHQVGVLHLQPSWDEQESTMSPRLRKSLRRSHRLLESLGRPRLHLARPSRGDSALGLLESGFALEHAGWKGVRGSSVLSDDRAMQFMMDQARQLITKHQFSTALLELNGRVIAFEHGWFAKNVYHSYKIAYDEEFRRFSPGQVLLHCLLEQFHSTQEAQAVDFLGPIDSAVRRWRPECYWMGRLLIAPPKPVGRALVFASRFLMTGGTMPVVE